MEGRGENMKKVFNKSVSIMLILLMLFSATPALLEAYNGYADDATEAVAEESEADDVVAEAADPQSEDNNLGEEEAVEEANEVDEEQAEDSEEATEAGAEGEEQAEQTEETETTTETGEESAEIVDESTEGEAPEGESTEGEEVEPVEEVVESESQEEEATQEVEEEEATAAEETPTVVPFNLTNESQPANPPNRNDIGEGSVLYTYEPFFPEDPTTQIYTGMLVTHRARIEVSGARQENFYAELKIPKTNTVKSSIDLAKPVPGGVFEVLPDDTDPDYYVARLTFAELTAGTSLFPKFRYRVLEGPTPDGYKSEVIFDVKKSDGTPYAEEIKVENTFKTVKPQETLKFAYHNKQNEWITQGDPDNPIYGGPGDGTSTGTIDPSSAEKIVFSYKVSHDGEDSNPYYGKRNYNQVVIEDTIPEGAVFVQEDNPGWTYDPNTRIAKYVYDKNESGTFFPYRTDSDVKDWISNNQNEQLKLVLNFGDTQVLDGEGVKKFVNSVKTTYKVDNPQGGEPSEFVGTDALGDQIEFYLNLNEGNSYLVTKSPEDRYFMETKDELEVGAVWNIQFLNNLSATYNVKIEDHTLDPALQYTGVKTYPDGTGAVKFGTSETANDGAVKVTLQMEDGSTVAIPNSIPLADPNVEIKFSDYVSDLSKIKGVSFEAENGHVVYSAGVMKIKLLTEFKDPEAAQVGDDKFYQDFYNHAKGQGYYKDGDELKPGREMPVKDYIRVFPHRPHMYLNKYSSVETGPMLDYGGIIAYRLILREQEWYLNLFEGEEVEMRRIVDVLPKGVEYIPNTTQVSYPHAGDPAGKNDALLEAVEPVLGYNTDTNQQTLTWNFDKSIFGNADTADTTAYIEIQFKTKVNDFADPGTLQNNAYAIWDNNRQDVTKPAVNVVGSTGYKDALDIDGDGNTTEEIGYNYTNVTLNPPDEVRSFKEIEDTVNGGWSSSESWIQPYSDFRYNFTIRNMTVSTVGHINLIDRLPFVGDTSVVEGVARDSEFKVTLSDSQAGVEIPEGFTVYYNPSSSATFDGAGWVEHSQVTDWESMRMIKIVGADDTVIKPHSTFRFPIIVKTNEIIDLGEGYIMEEDVPLAINDFAKKTDEGEFIDVVPVKAKYVYFNLAGVAFKDNDGNDLYNQGDTIFSNIKVELLDADGNPVLDKDGNPITTTTDANGNYKFRIYKSGEYRVRFNNEGYEVVNKGELNATDASHVSNVQVSDKVLFNTTVDDQGKLINSFHILNAGYRGKVFTMTKVLQDADGNVIDDQRDFNFTLKVNGTPYSGEATIVNLSDNVETEITVAGGAVTMKNGQSIIVPNLDEGTVVSLTETNHDLYQVFVGDTETDTVEHKITGTSNDVTFTNKELAKGNLNVTKIVKDGEGNVLTDVRTFTIKVTGPTYPNGEEFTITNAADGKVQLTDLKYGDYTIVELNADSEYTVTPATQTVTVSAAEQTANVTVTNTEKALGSLEISKELQDADGNVLTDERTFTVTVTGPTYPNGQEFEVKNTAPTVVSNLAYGTYTVAEEDVTAEYTVTGGTQQATITVANKTGELTITNKEKPLGKLNVTKTLLDAAGNAITEERTFNVRITGPSYPTGQEFELKNSDSGKIELTGLKYGTYTVQELDASETYQVTGETQTVTISLAEKEGNLNITNQEKALGSLEVTKTVLNANGDIMTDERSFTVKIIGPSYPNGQEFELKNSATGSVQVTGLQYGEYTVEEIGADGDYEVTVDKSSVTLSLEHREDSVQVTNKEKPLGELNLVKTLLDIDDNAITEERTFTVKVTGPSYPNGQEFELKNTEDTKIEGLIYGEYTVEELNASEEYTVTNETQTATLSIGHKSETLDITNKEKPLGVLKIEKIVQDAEGNVIDVDRTFMIKVTGPSYPNGEEFELKSTEPTVIEDLIYGEYTVEEFGAEDNYEVIDGTGTLTVNIAEKTAEMAIINKEKPLGEINITKTLFDAQDKAIDEDRTFKIKVTGPSYPNGQEFELKVSAPVELKGLIYGEYTVEELGVEGEYGVTLDAEKVVIDIENKSGKMNVENKELAVGKIIIEKVLKDSAGNIVTTPKVFTVKVTGPSYPEGEEFNITNASPLIIENLIYGKYTVEEINVTKYDVTGGKQDVELNIKAKEAKISICNKAKPGAPYTGDAGSSEAAIMLMLLVMATAALVAYRRKLEIE